LRELILKEEVKNIVYFIYKDNAREAKEYYGT
jgi:hypothetical protein